MWVNDHDLFTMVHKSEIDRPYICVAMTIFACDPVLIHTDWMVCGFIADILEVLQNSSWAD